MRLHSNYQRAIVVALLASLTIGTVAPAAWAGHGRGRYQKHRRGPAVQRVVQVHRSDSFAPVFAGLIGGLALGAVLGSAGSSGQAHAYGGHRGRGHAEFHYWDPYCRVRYSSLDSYGRHVRNHDCDHPRRVRVISNSSGDCVRSMDYSRGEWRECDRDDDRKHKRGRYSARQSDRCSDEDRDYDRRDERRGRDDRNDRDEDWDDDDQGDYER